ncbi:hypothetical protein E1281_11700 [Actinomadura sp. KC345]|uniref:hypothetical protein n=1 Tax=Actinomadura sp. KC345 TaxID=2530371 RepID=UPI00104965F4|nr:hypothetical protein [Actinomadura sp. KC345]TDC55591.1 hypothetical protein E1281_11700 [Actinomadura sp. KC345]
MNLHSDTSAAPFWVDEDYDRAQASDGVSRYGSYVRDRLNGSFAECWDGTFAEPSSRLVEFASAAWRTATGPVMAPGYIRLHSRVLSAQLQRSHWDGSLIAAVSLVAPWPASLADSVEWRQGRCWRDWPTELRGDGYVFVDPTERDVTRHPFMQASLALTFSVPVGGLPAAPQGPGDGVEERARRAVEGLVVELNRVVGPVLDVLEEGRAR